MENGKSMLARKSTQFCGYALMFLSNKYIDKQSNSVLAHTLLLYKFLLDV
jgi:hypothetical protein